MIVVVFAAALANLALRCEGVATVEDPTFVSASAYGANGSTSGSAVVSGSRDSQETVNLEVGSEGGRIRLPRPLIPTIHSGGVDGWWPLKTVDVREHEILATFSLNIFNKPKLRIDRTSGGIELSGMGEAYRGTCAPSTVENKF